MNGIFAKNQPPLSRPRRPKGEENGITNAETSRRWILDPLDGTTSFALGVPLFGVLIAMVEEGEPVISIVHMPLTNENYFAVCGEGCWRDLGDASPTRCLVLSTTLASSLVSISSLHGTNLDPVSSEQRCDLESVAAATADLHFCGECMQHTLMCRGWLQIAIDTTMQPWDTATLVAWVREAGGVVANLSGSRERLSGAGDLMSAASEFLRDESLALFREKPIGVVS